MKLFQKKGPSEEDVVKKAERLICTQLEDKWHHYIDYRDERRTPAPATEYAHKLIEEAISSKMIQEKIDDYLSEAVTKEVIREEVKLALDEVLKQDLIGEIVAKINKLQLGDKL
mgnify:CR=1 FL=1